MDSVENLHCVAGGTTDKHGVFYGRYIVAGCFVLSFLFAGAGFYSFSIFIAPLEEAFGWNRSEISAAMSLYMIVNGVIGPFVGHLTEAHGPKKVMTAFAVISGSAFILVSFSSTLWFFYAAYALLAVGTTGIGFIPVSSVLARWYVRRRGSAIGVAMLGISVGGLLMAPLVGWVIAWVGWRMAFVFLGLLVWVLGIPITAYVIKADPREMGLLPDGEILERDCRRTSGSGSGAGSPGHGVTVASEAPSVGLHVSSGWPAKAALRTPTFFWISLAFLLAPLAQMGMLQHQVPIIVEAGLSPAWAATGLGLTAGFGGLGKLCFGRISEEIPFRYAVMLCFGLQAFGVLLVFCASSTLMVWAYVLVFGFAMGGVIVLLPLVVAHFLGLASFGVLMGTLSLVAAVGDAAGALISGLVYDLFGSYDYAMQGYMLLYVLATAAIFMAGEPRPYSKRLFAKI